MAIGSRWWRNVHIRPSHCMSQTLVEMVGDVSLESLTPISACPLYAHLSPSIMLTLCWSLDLPKSEVNHRLVGSYLKG